MLETPLYGRFVGENKRLVFAPTGAYVTFVNATTFAGAAMACLGLLGGLGVGPVSGSSWWFAFTGPMVLFAGILANLSLARITFDLKERTYRRRFGQGFSGTHGKLADLDAVVLIAEPQVLRPSAITYHLVLHWKGRREPHMVLQSDTREIAPGQSLGAAAGALQQRGVQFSHALGVPFYDNSHFPSPNPTPLLR